MKPSGIASCQTHTGIPRYQALAWLKNYYKLIVLSNVNQASFGGGLGKLEDPGTSNELSVATTIEVIDIYLKNFHLQDTVLTSYLGLAAVDAHIWTVHLIHSVVQEYLFRPGIFPGSHWVLPSQSCFTLLNYDQAAGLLAIDVSTTHGCYISRKSKLGYTTARTGRYQSE